MDGPSGSTFEDQLPRRRRVSFAPFRALGDTVTHANRDPGFSPPRKPAAEAFHKPLVSDKEGKKFGDLSACLECIACSERSMYRGMS